MWKGCPRHVRPPRLGTRGRQAAWWRRMRGQDPSPVTHQLNYPGGSPESMGQYNGGAASNVPQPLGRNFSLTSARVWTGNGKSTLNFSPGSSVMTFAPDLCMTIFTDKVNPVLKENVVCAGRASSMTDACLDTQHKQASIPTPSHDRQTNRAPHISSPELFLPSAGVHKIPESLLSHSVTLQGVRLIFSSFS